MGRLAEAYGDRVRVGPDEIEALLADVGSQLTREVLAFDIGGSPMVSRGLKDGTKDIDLVLESKEDREELVEILQEMGYEMRTSEPEYAGLEAYLFRKDGAVGVDLFVRRIMQKLVLSDGMKERADAPVQFGNLTVRSCANEDIFLLKSVTDRPDDDEDLYFLLATGIDTDAMRRELEGQPARSDGLSWSEHVHRRLSKVEERTGREIVLKGELLE